MTRENVSPAATEALVHYAAMLEHYASRLNLISSDDMARVEERHIDDSLRLLPLLGEAPEGPCADVGSGAGLPGIPLAIAEPRRLWRLFEPRRQRSAFLEEVARELTLTLEVIPHTAQEAARDPRWSATHAFVTARALAPPPQALALCRPLLSASGVLVLLIGAAAPPPAGSELWSEGIAIVRG